MYPEVPTHLPLNIPVDASKDAAHKRAFNGGALLAKNLQPRDERQFEEHEKFWIDEQGLSSHPRSTAIRRGFRDGFESVMGPPKVRGIY